MPRPMYLIKEPYLKELTDLHSAGVPVATLVNKYSLDITPPTLSKLIKTMRNYLECNNERGRVVMEASLFPEWLKNMEDGPLGKQPTTHKYIGPFPIGKWILK